MQMVHFHERRHVDRERLFGHQIAEYVRAKRIWPEGHAPRESRSGGKKPPRQPMCERIHLPLDEKHTHGSCRYRGLRDREERYKTSAHERHGQTHAGQKDQRRESLSRLQPPALREKTRRGDHEDGNRPRVEGRPKTPPRKPREILEESAKGAT